MKKALVSIIIIIFFCTCKKNSKLETIIDTTNVKVDVERFDQLFGNSTAKDLPKLKKAYPFMFAKKFKDSFWVAKINDTLQKELVLEVSKTFNDTDILNSKLESLFKHVSHYFPEFKLPRVITTTSNVDYRNNVIVTDTIVLIALDTYLGKEHYFYQNIQKFLRKNFEPNQIEVDVARKYAEKFTYQLQRKTFLDEMIYFGKILYVLDVLLPQTDEAQRIGYTEDELNWVKRNEHYIWRYFIDRELLYSSDSKLFNRFIKPAPFSKFYLEGIDTNSPGRVGQFIGKQIVTAYIKNNNVPLREMLNTKPQDIFIKSKFKPRK